ncbi:hypothetical protein DPMN_011563 [Dreissena polymorpha]|uniref:Uncharacterized protein n=1 Tax=Dreissena polymorpha TaxID=45954 RepID=A0A9D4N491_DREPO|nr:hypothetical protein DPMN_011563 [Dreissena polymorpha]
MQFEACLHAQSRSPEIQKGTKLFCAAKDIIRTNVLTKLHEKEKCPTLWPPCFVPTGPICEQLRDIIGTNLLTKFHNRSINLDSIEKNAPPPGSHVFQAIITIFQLAKDIIGTNHLTNFHDDQTISNVFQPKGTIFELVHDIMIPNFMKIRQKNKASRVLTRKNALLKSSCKYLYIYKRMLFIYIYIEHDLTNNAPSIVPG